MIALLWCVGAQAADAMVVVGDASEFHVVEGSHLLSPAEFAWRIEDGAMWTRLDARRDRQQLLGGLGVGLAAGVVASGLGAALVGNAVGNRDVALVGLGVAGTGLGVASTSALALSRMRRETRDMSSWYTVDTVRQAAASWNGDWGVAPSIVEVRDSTSVFSVHVDGRVVDAHEAALRLGDLRTWRRLGWRQFGLSMATWGSAHAMTVLGTVALGRLGWGGAPFALGAAGALVVCAVAGSAPRRPMPHEIWTEDEARALARSVSTAP